jgi:hypothetical protein
MSIVKKLSDIATYGVDSYGTEDALAYFNTMEHARGATDTLLHRFEADGYGDAVKINEELVKVMGDPVLKQENVVDKTYYNEYTDASTYIRIYFNGGEDRDIQIRGITATPAVYDKLKEIVSTFIDMKKPSNFVFALMSGHNGLSLRSVGKINHDLVVANYSKEAIEGYKHITECLSSKDPCGRLILLQGAPGTGKSYMIRSLVSNINSTFIVVGAHMIAELSGPAILPVILQCVDTDDPKPITFILEDSDIALSHRKNGGVAELSGLLNLGDGLLGDLLDIRILATTNAELLDLDPAVVRPGRMCQHIKLEAFNPKDASALYSNMVKGKALTLRKPTTLAEIYRMAREDGWVPKAEKKEVGQYL